MSDLGEIAQLIQCWGLCRDQGRWEDLAGTFAPNGTISVTWFSGQFTDFIAASKTAYKDASPRTKHLLGAPVVQVNGNRAVAETNTQILGRFEQDGIAIDNTSYARFLDRLTKTCNGWQITQRVAIYEKDRLDPVEPSEEFEQFMATTDFSQVPEPYRYLGYRLISSGRPLADKIICDGSPDALAVLSDASAWLTSN
jgi:SnoaL-like protein